MAKQMGFWLAVGVLCTVPAANGAQTFVAFGLTNSTIGNATYTSNQFLGFHVANLGSDGFDGVSIDLGQADSGVFVSPATDMDPPTGSFMAGSLYGSVNGETNRLICFMRCHEQEDGLHPVAIDFSSLGPTHLTFQAFRFGALVAQTDPQPGPMVVYGDYFTPYYPRVNPFRRMPDGSIGALIEFSELAAISLPGVGDLSADRIFIRADNPTNVVDFASRLDITARLPYFRIDDTWLGMFNRAHRALGNAQLRAQSGILRVSNVGTSDEDGLAIELHEAVRFDVRFTPVQLETNDVLTILAMGNTEEASGVLGTARIERTNGSLNLSAVLDIATSAEVAVYCNGAQTGTAAGTNAIVPSTATVIGCELHSRISEGQAGIVVRLGQTVPVTLPNQITVSGDEIRFTGNSGFTTLRMLALNTTGLNEFTIVSETEHPLPRPRLEIMRSGNQLELSWIDPYRAFKLETASDIGEIFYDLGEIPDYVGNRATIVLQVDVPSTRFYRLSAAPFFPDD